MLGGQVDTATNLRLWEASRGNPLFLRELVLDGRDRGALAERGGVWSWEGRLGGGTRLTELIEARLSGLATKDRRVLEELAAGEPLGPAILGGAEKVAALERLEARGLVTTVEDGRRTTLRLSHPLYAEALRTGTGPLRRRAVQRAQAENLAATGVRRRHDVLRLATWQVDGGGPVDRVSLVEAARQARALFEHTLAERLARRAVEEGGSVEAALVLGDTLYWQGRHREAQEVLDLTATGAVDDEQRATSAISRSSNLFWGLGRGEEAQQLLRSTSEQVDDPDWRDELTAHWASLRLFGGHVEQARVAAEAVLFRPGASERAQARALATVIPAWTLAGRPESAAMIASVVLADVVGPAGTAAEHPGLVAELLQGQAVAYWLGGRLADMEQVAGEGYRAAVERAADDYRGPWALLLGWAALARGHASTARDRLREAAALLQRQDVGGFLPWCLAAGAHACALLGDVASAENALVEARRCRLESVRIHDVELVLAGAWVKAAAGEVSAAASQAAEAADVAAASGMGIVEVLALHDAMRLGGGVAVARRLVERAAPLEGALAPALADHARAVVAGDAGELDRAADAFVALGMPLVAAEAAAGAADLHRVAGRASSQLAALSRSRSLAETCEGARTPALLRAGQAPDLHWLTRREREVVELAARSLTKRQIADRLVVSIRTVGNHLNHAYAKLGVTCREDLDRLVGLGAGVQRESASPRTQGSRPPGAQGEQG